VPAGLSNVVAIATGYSHVLALKNNGTVIAWGDDSSGQTNIPPDLTNVVAISAAWNSVGSVALKDDGTLVSWPAKSDVLAGVTNAAALATGSGDSSGLAFMSNGLAIAWGDNTYGQTNIPPDLHSAISGSLGSRHDLVLRTDGTIFAWGSNIGATSGNAYVGQATIPYGLSNVLMVSAGGNQSLALRSIPIRITSVCFENSNAVVRFYGLAGKSYFVQVSTDLDVGSWVPLTVLPVPGNNEQISVVDPSTPATGSRFYRLVMVQN